MLQGNRLLTVVAVAHNELRYNRPLIESLLNQKDPVWKCIVYHNGPNQEMKQWTDSYQDTRLLYLESQTDTGHWGTWNRQTAVSHYVDTDYILNTSIQDYYLPNAIGAINKYIEQGSDLVTWQAINHLFNYNTLSGEIAFGHLDWGQWAVRTEYLKTTGIVRGEEFCADWFTLQEVRKLCKNIMKINTVLTIHN